jgi:hypothetical protein
MDDALMGRKPFTPPFNQASGARTKTRLMHLFNCLVNRVRNTQTKLHRDHEPNVKRVCEKLAGLLWDIDTVNTSSYRAILLQTSVLSFQTLHANTIEGLASEFFMHTNQFPLEEGELPLESRHKRVSR